MTKISYTVEPPDAGDVFHPGAFRNTVGKVIPFKVDGETVGDAEVISVQVSADRRSAEVTLLIPDGVIPQPQIQMLGVWPDRIG